MSLANTIPSEPRSERPTQPSSFLRYGVAALCAVVAVLAAGFLPASEMSLALWPVLIMGMIISAAYGGPGASLFTAALELAGVSYLIYTRGPRFSLYTEMLLLGGFAGTALAISALSLLNRRRQDVAWVQLEARERECADIAIGNAQLRAATETAERRTRNAIQDRELMRDRLRASETRLSLAAESSRFVLFEWDLGEKIDISGDLKQVFGVRRQAWDGYRSFLDAVSPQDRDFVQVQLASAVAGLTPLDLECRVTWPGGDEHWISAKGRFATGDDDQPPRMFGIFQEITQRKASEEALIRQEKLAAAGRLAATIAHEINNPLAAITNLIYIVKGDPTLSDAGRKYIELAQDELTRAAEIAKQTLGFYKENTEPVRFNVADVVEEVLSVYARRLPAHIKLEKEFRGRTEIEALKGEIRQVISNLLSNAVYALEKGGVLKISVRPEKLHSREGALIQVSDNGNGIGPEHRKRLFEPFFTTRKEIGTGLGLWVVHQIVHKHGGTIEVDSSTEPDRHGTCFTVFLPATVHQNEDRGAAA